MFIEDFLFVQQRLFNYCLSFPYSSSSPSPLLLSSPQVKQGFEPPTFSCHFLGWNPNLWAQDSSYETYRKQVTQGVTSVQEELKKYDEGRKFPYEQLKGKSCPQGVDPTMKEVVRPNSSSHTCPFYIPSYSARFIVFVPG